MESRHQDTETFYKELEKEWNIKIHTYTNSLTFITKFGKSLENQLDLIVIHRKLINNWLTAIDIPDKEDFVNFAGRKVDCVEKIDSLEDTIYELNRGMKKNNTELKKLNKTLSDMLYIIETEVRNVKACKIKTLENELEELKILFKD